MTLPQYFAQHGYHTMGVGKVLHHPNKADWDELSPIVYWQNPLPPGIPENNRRNVAEYLEDWLPLDVDAAEMTDWKMGDWAAVRLGRTYDKPFFLACINFADECVGRLLDALDASPHKNDTVVMLWSDHGWHLGEKLHWSKFTLWEESARCVLICAGPGVKPGTRCEQPVNLMDMYPTLSTTTTRTRWSGITRPQNPNSPR